MTDVSDVFRAAAAEHATRSLRGMTRDNAGALCAERTLPPAAARSPVLRSAYDTLALVREVS
jgi:hypothetical protein